MGRFQSVVSRANKTLTLQFAAALLAGSTLLSSILGLFRERLFNARYLEAYPAGAEAYTVAFTIPDFMYYVLVSGALSVTFIPVFNQRLASGNKKSAWQLSSSLLNLMALATFVASILIIIFAEPLVGLVGGGLDEASRSLAVSMMRVLAVNPLLFSITTVIFSMQQAIGRFAFFALAPVLYNVGIIIGITVFTNGIYIFGWELFEGGIMGVAFGVVLGAVLQLIVSAIGLFGMGFDYQFKIFWKNKGFRQVLRLLPARSLDQSIDYVNNIVEISVATRLGQKTGEAVARSYQQALTLHMVPINLIGVAISTAAFPKMTERLSQGRPDLFKKELQSVLRVIIWLALPVATIAFFGRGYLVNFIANGGNVLISGLFGALCIAILFRSVYHIASRSFYAQQDTKTPLYISFISIGLNIFLAIWLSLVLDFGPYGLAWASSIVAIVEVTILFTIMSRRIKGLFDKPFLGAVLRMLSATGFTAVAAYGMVLLMPLPGGEQSFFSTFPQFALISAVSLSVYLAVCRVLQLEEVRPVLRHLRKIMLGGVKG